MMLHLAWKNVWRNKLRSGILIGSMVFGFMGVMLMIGFMNAMIASMVENAIQYQSGHIQVHNPQFIENEELGFWLPNADEEGERIRSLSGVAGVSVRQVVDGMIGSAAASRGVRINGIFGPDEAQVTSLGDNIVEGTNLSAEGRNPLLISRRNAEKLKVRLGSKVVLTLTDIRGEVTGAAFRVGGIFQTPSTLFDEGGVFVRRADLATLVGTDHPHEITVRLEREDVLQTVKAQVVTVVGAHGVVRDWREIQPLLSTLIGAMDISNGILVGVFMLALGFGIVNVMLMSVFERQREFGMLMAIGMAPAKLIQLIALESFFLGAVGSLCGMGASLLLIAITGHWGLPFGKMAEGLGFYGVDTVLYPSVPLSYYGGVLAIILLTSLLAALYPTRLIMKKSPHEAMVVKY